MNRTPVVFIRTMISIGLSLGSDEAAFQKNLKKKLTDIGFFYFGLLKDLDTIFLLGLRTFGFLDTGRLILYQSTSISKVAVSTVPNNRKITLFLTYGFYLSTRRLTIA